MSKKGSRVFVGLGFLVVEVDLEEVLVRALVDEEVLGSKVVAVWIPKYLEIEGCTSLLNSGADVCRTLGGVGTEAVLGASVAGRVSSIVVGTTFEELACWLMPSALW